MASIGEPIAAALTSWAGTADTTSLPYYLATYNKFKGFVWTAKGATFDSSAFGGPANFKTNGASMLSIDFALEAHMGTPQDGYLGLVTFSGGEVLNLNGYEINISRDLHPDDSFGNQYRAFKPGLVSISGSIEGNMDATTAMKRPLLTAGWGSATFDVLTAAEDSGTTGKRLLCPINYTESKATLTRGGPATKAYNFIASGAMTTAGTNTNILWAVDSDGSMLSNLNTANPPSILLTEASVASSGTLLQLGGVAYWKSIKLKTKMGSPVMITVEGSFSGTPTTVTAMGS